MNDRELAFEAFMFYGDWGITWMSEEFEGWEAMLHETSACYCHAPPDFKCDKYCADPQSITRLQAEALIRLGVPVLEETA